MIFFRKKLGIYITLSNSQLILDFRKLGIKFKGYLFAIARL